MTSQLKFTSQSANAQRKMMEQSLILPMKAPLNRTAMASKTSTLMQKSKSYKRMSNIAIRKDHLVKPHRSPVVTKNIKSEPEATMQAQLAKQPCSTICKHPR